VNTEIHLCMVLEFDFQRIRNMDDNQDQLRLGKVSRYAMFTGKKLNPCDHQFDIHD
ncbi:hypothetical protein RYX36_001149, partial [Vicia faba]